MRINDPFRREMRTAPHHRARLPAAAQLLKGMQRRHALHVPRGRFAELTNTGYPGNTRSKG
jgi:hypothetical protein